MSIPIIYSMRVGNIVSGCVSFVACEKCQVATGAPLIVSRVQIKCMGTIEVSAETRSMALLE